MADTKAFKYRLSEGGDLYISGVMPDLLSPEQAPYYAERDRILRVIAEEGCTVGDNAFCGYPHLRVASLVGARRVGVSAFFGCPRLAAVSFSSVTATVAHNAFAECPALVFVDFAGDEEALEASCPISLLLQEGRIVRTVTPGRGETVAAGELGGGHWYLTEDGTLTVDGDDIPDCRYPQDVPWHAHRREVRRVIVGHTVGRIGDRAFSALPALTYAAVLGNTEVGAFAFSSCSRLFEIVIFPGVTSLGICAFAGTAPVALFLGASVRALPAGLLQSCRPLKTLLLPLFPLREAADVTADCPTLRELRYLGPFEEIDEMVGNRAVSLSHRPIPVLAVSSPEGAERALAKAEAGRLAVSRTAERVERAHAEAEALCLEVYECIGRAEEAYVKAEGCRLGYDTPKRRGREERRLLHREHRALLRSSRKLTRHLDRLAGAAGRLERECRRTDRLVAAAKGRIFALYPFGSTLALRADGIAAYVSAAGACPARAYATAAERARHFAGLFPYRRYQEVRYRYADLATLMEGLAPDAAPRDLTAPRILIAGALTGEDAGAEACAHAIRRAGGIPVMASGRPSDHGFDALILCDGGAIDPLMYDERRRGMQVDEGRDRRDAALFDAFYLYGKPILGIGRGCGMLNVRLGGTLHRALRASNTAHASGTVHPILVDPQSYLYKLYKPAMRPMHVISHHAWGLGELGRELAVIARAEDGVIEAIRHKGQPVYGVMFSPERMPAPAPFVAKRDAPENGDPLFAWFCAEARAAKKKPLTKKIGKRYSTDE